MRHNPGLRNAAGEPCVTLRGAARRLGISPAAVRYAMRAGHFTKDKVRIPMGQFVMLIPVSQVRAYARKRASREARCATK